MKVASLYSKGRSLEDNDEFLQPAADVKNHVTFASSLSSEQGLRTKSFDVTAASGGSSMSTDPTEERTMDQIFEPAIKASDSLWQLFNGGARDESSSEDDMSLLSSENSYDLQKGSDLFTVSTSASSKTRDNATATSATTSTSLYQYESCGCCGCGGVSKDADDSTSCTSLDPRGQLQPIVTINSSTSSPSEQSVQQDPSDENETLSVSRTEYRVGSTTLLWDDDRLEVETQQLSKDCGGESTSYIASERAIEESTAASASTVDRHSLLRSILFKKTVAMVSDPKRAVATRNKFYGSSGKPTEAEADPALAMLSGTNEPAAALDERLTTGDVTENTGAKNTAKLGLSLFLSSILPVRDMAVHDSPVVSAVSNEKNEHSTDFEDAKVKSKESPQNEGQPLVVAPVATNNWSMVLPMKPTCRNGAESSNDRGLTRHQRNADPPVGQIGERIAIARAKSEERRKIQKQEQLSSKRGKARKTGDRMKPKRSKLKRKLLSKSPGSMAKPLAKTRIVTSGMTLNSSHPPLCGAMDIIDTILGNVWKSSDQLETTERSQRYSSRNATMRDQADFRTFSRPRNGAQKSPERRLSLLKPRYEAGLDFPVKRSGNDQHQLFCITRTKGGELILHEPSASLEINHYPRRRNMHPSMATPLCGAGLFFSAMGDEDEPTKTSQRARSKVSVQQTHGESGHRASEQGETDFQKRTSSRRQRLFPIKKQAGPSDRPIPGRLPTTKPAKQMIV